MLSFSLRLLLGLIYLVPERDSAFLSQMVQNKPNSTTLLDGLRIVLHDWSLRLYGDSVNDSYLRSKQQAFNESVHLVSDATLIGLQSPSRALSTRSIEFGNICSVQGQRSTIVGHSLFFMSGGYKTIGNAGNVSDWKSEHVLFFLDLDTSFPVEVLLSSDFLHNVSIPPTTTPDIIKQAESYWAGALFATNSSLYVYGGVGPNITSTPALAAYNIATSSWEQISTSGADYGIGDGQFGQSVSDPISGLSFFTGGSSGVQGMLTFNASNPDDLIWTYQTEKNGIKDISVPNVLGGELVYLPVGKKGALLLLGGSDASEYPAFDMLSMENVAVYDIDSDNWYPIVATGISGIPNGRTEFCSVVSRAPDDSSFQVTMYGGTLENETYYDDVWALSIPSFQWIKINDTNNQERMTNGAAAGRKGHTCTIWDDSQMIVLGGIYASNAATQVQGDGNKSVCDTSYSPIRVLDTSSYSWKMQYQPNNTYSVPSTISAIIGGDSSGKSSLKSPVGGWNDSALVDIFSRTLPRLRSIVSSSSTSTLPPYSPTSTSTLSAARPPTPKSSGNSTAAIAGGITATFFVCIAAIVTILFVRRRKKKSKTSVTRITVSHQAEMEWAKPELGGQPLQELPTQRLQHAVELENQNPRVIHELRGAEFSELPPR